MVMLWYLPLQYAMVSPTPNKTDLVACSLNYIDASAGKEVSLFLCIPDWCCTVFESAAVENNPKVNKMA